MNPLAPTVSAAAPALLAARGLACERDGRQLFRPLDLAVQAGDIVELMGDNGAGKSTLLRTLAGMSPDYRGELDFQGSSLRDGAPELASSMLFLGHRSGLNAQLGPDENLAWYARLASGDAADASRIDAALRTVGLIGYLGVPCGQLSAGQQRRAALARLLLSRARLWLLDEPTTALDTAGVALLDALLRAHRARGGAAVIATHARIAAATATLVLESADEQPDAHAPHGGVHGGSGRAATADGTAGDAGA